MLRTKNKLSVFHDKNSTFSDYSGDALDFDRDFFTIELSSSMDYLYIGFDKPINAIYLELKTTNNVTNTLYG